MNPDGAGWSLDLPLAEPGYFKAKAYALDPRGWQRWPEGPDVGISVHPNKYRTSNILYCAFTRLFGKERNRKPEQELAPEATASPDEASVAALPASGKLRDLAKSLPHIIERLGCRILHLLPGQSDSNDLRPLRPIGSPYAALD